MRILLVLSLIAFPFFSNANANSEKERSTDNSEMTINENSTTNLKGSVGDINNYEPINGVSVVVSSLDNDFTQTVQTDATGHFSFADLKAGKYQLKFQKNGYEVLTRKYVVVEGGKKANYGFFLFRS